MMMGTPVMPSMMDPQQGMAFNTGVAAGLGTVPMTEAGLGNWRNNLNEDRRNKLIRKLYVYCRLSLLLTHLLMSICMYHEWDRWIILK